jgi:tetratricopeptide (TPR) repeat protein
MVAKQFWEALPLPAVYTPKGMPPSGVDLPLWLQGNEAALAAKAHIQRGRLNEARGLAEKAADLFTRAGDRRQATACQGVIGDIVLREGSALEALEIYENSCAAARISGNADLEAISLLKAAALYKLAGDTEIFDAYRKRAAAIAPEVASAKETKLPTLPATTPAPTDKARQQGVGPVPTTAELGLAGEMLDLSERLSKSSSDPDLNFFALFTKGEALRAQEAHDAAVEAFTDALRSAEAIPGGATGDPVNRLQLIGTKLGLAESRIALGRPKEALADLNAALKLTPQSPAPKVADNWMQDFSRIRCCDLMGKASLLLGQIEDAETNMMEAVEICLAWQNVPLRKDTFLEVSNAFGNSTVSLCMLLSETHRSEQGWERLRSALNAFETTGNQLGQAAVHLEIANVLSAIEHRNTERASGRRIPAIAATTEAISHLDAAQGLYKKAGSRNGMAATAGARAVLLLEAGWPAQALEALREAMQLHEEIGASDDLCQDWRNEGRAYWNLGMHAEARHAFKEARRIASERALEDHLWISEASLGLLELSLGEFGAAREPLESAVAIMESQRALLVAENYKGIFFIGKESVYEALVRVLLKLGHPDLAFLGVERSRSRALLDLMRTANLRMVTAVPPEWLREEASLLERERVAMRTISAGGNAAAGPALRSQAREARRSLDILLERIASVAPEYAALRRGDPASFEDAERLVDGGRRVILAEYQMGEHEVRIFGIVPGAGKPDIVTVPIDASELRRFARQSFGAHGKVRELVADGLEPLWHAYDVLVEPIVGWAKRGDIVYLIPHGLLHYLPMHALKVGGDYLIERNPIVYAPSTSVLKFCRAKRKPRPWPVSAYRVAVFGDSRSDLPMARREAEQVASMFGSRALLDKDVDRKAVRGALTASDLVHFAGHGYFNSSDPLASGLLLAGGESLTAREILEMGSGFQPGLLVLSGCETGISEHAPGDELLGLTRAFLFAGAPSLLMSLWRVNDESTAFLMGNLYSRLCNENTRPTVADALQQAVLETKRMYPSMDRWAPFTLVGDWC